MTRILRPLFLVVASACPLLAGTVLVTTVPDEQHVIEPLTTLAGIPLAAGTQFQVGAFPGLNDAQLLDLASQGGLAQVSAAFVSFGSPCVIGQGVDGAAGGFEIGVRDSGAASAWLGQTVSVLIQTAGGEFLVARFEGKVFEGETETGLEPLLSLHLADARVIVGSRVGESHLATSTAPSVGSFNTWLAGFPRITDVESKSLSADADSDGRSNFLEYATGGDPSSAGDAPPCTLEPAADGGFWVVFSRVPGLGAIRYRLESSADLGSSPWLEAEGNLEPDPGNPALMRMHVLAPLPASGFFRLDVKSTP